MGRLFDEKCYLYGSCKCQTAGCVVRPDNGCPVYRYFKDIIIKDYENRFKEDMVARLTDIQLEIEEQSLTHSEDNILSEWGLGYNHSVERCGELIQTKINALKVRK